MICAVYARRSNEQSDVSDDAKSVTGQIESARAYAGRKGWTVADEHVYKDDGISGAIFGAGRPGLARLLNALSPRPPFEALIMSEESRSAATVSRRVTCSRRSSTAASASSATSTTASVGSMARWTR